jgi:hypothetical protein
MAMTVDMMVHLADQYIPAVIVESKKTFPLLTKPILIAGQIEQETCASIKKCWNPKTELKTSREYGFGLGQLTIAYKADGTERMNNFKYAKTLDKSLADWKWEDRYNPSYQIRTMIVMDRIAYNQMSFAKNDIERQAFMFSAYNGGVGGVLKDRTLCKATKGCDPSVWFGNVEKYSFKNKVAVKGYGKSFFEINREYVQFIMNTRWMKYVASWKKNGGTI